MAGPVLNLINNAIKFRSDRPPEIRLAAERHGAEWMISVTDNGIGINPQYYEKLFVIFQRLHGLAEYPVNGLGLAMYKKLVERQGGQIWVESEPGKGSSFWFTLPAAV
jgi:light-regulated signal transduction histidine kinase (bacteriophytochrome)